MCKKKGRTVDFGQMMRRREGLEVVGRIVTLQETVSTMRKEKICLYEKERSNALKEAWKWGL